MRPARGARSLIFGLGFAPCIRSTTSRSPATSAVAMPTVIEIPKRLPAQVRDRQADGHAQARSRALLAGALPGELRVRPADARRRRGPARRPRADAGAAPPAHDRARARDWRAARWPTTRAATTRLSRWASTIRRTRTTATLAELPPHVAKELQRFFGDYKILEGRRAVDVEALYDKPPRARGHRRCARCLRTGRRALKNGGRAIIRRGWSRLGRASHGSCSTCCEGSRCSVCCSATSEYFYTGRWLTWIGRAGLAAQRARLRGALVHGARGAEPCADAVDVVVRPGLRDAAVGAPTPAASRCSACTSGGSSCCSRSARCT